MSALARQALVRLRLPAAAGACSPSVPLAAFARLMSAEAAAAVGAGAPSAASGAATAAAGAAKRARQPSAEHPQITHWKRNTTEKKPDNLKLDRATKALLLERPHPGDERPMSLVAVAPLPTAAAPTLPIYRLSSDGSAPVPTGETITLDPRVFAAPYRPDVIHSVVVWQDKNARSTLYKAKDRAEVRGGGIKPWRQKGTGRARHGSRRSPIWVGGGVAHGPVFREWGTSLNKKVRALGMRVALSAKVRDGRIMIVDDLATHLPEAKSGALARVVRSVAPSATDAPFTPTLFVDAPEVPPSVDRASRNLQHVLALPARGANVKDIVRAQALVVTRSAVEELSARLA